MSQEYKKLSTFEIRSMIKSLIDELDRRELETMSLNKKILAQQLKNCGYGDDEINKIDLEKLANREEKVRIKLLNHKLGTLRKIQPKYRNPKTKQEWAGRGAFPPNWVTQILNEKGWSLQEFKQSEEYRISNNIRAINKSNKDKTK